jgi:uncharacterized membrane protein YqjE
MVSETPTTPTSGFLGSIRAFLDGLLGSLQGRVELIALELQEEKLRLIQAYVWVSAAMFLGALTLLFGSLAIVSLFAESARPLVLGLLTLAYAVAFTAVLLAFRRYLRRQPRPFAGTIEELKEDRACIRPDS